MEWKNWSKATGRFFANIRRHGVRSYVYCVEANGGGGFHVHACCVLDKQHTFFEHIGWDKKKKKEVRSWRSDSLRELVRWYWGRIEWRVGNDGKKERVSISYGNSDVMGCKTSEVVGYITKEIFKSGSCEGAIRNFREGKKILDKSVKRILAFALVSGSGVRQFGCNRDITQIEVLDELEAIVDPSDTLSQLGVMEELEENPELVVLLQRLDSPKSNSANKTESRQIVIDSRSLLLLMDANKTDRKEYRPLPYCGIVPRGSLEYEKIKMFFENTELSQLWDNRNCSMTKKSSVCYKKDDLKEKEKLYEIINKINFEYAQKKITNFLDKSRSVC